MYHLADTPVTHKLSEVSLAHNTYSKDLCLLFFSSFNHLCADLREGSVNLRLTIVSTAGFGDQINKENRFASPLSQSSFVLPQGSSPTCSLS